MANAISTFNDVKRVVTEFIDKNRHLLENDGKTINTIFALKTKYNITSYLLAFENDTEAFYSYGDKKIITKSGISKKKQDYIELSA